MKQHEYLIFRIFLICDTVTATILILNTGSKFNQITNIDVKEYGDNTKIYFIMHFVTAFRFQTLSWGLCISKLFPLTSPSPEIDLLIYAVFIPCLWILKALIL